MGAAEYLARILPGFTPGAAPQPGGAGGVGGVYGGGPVRSDVMLQLGGGLEFVERIDQDDDDDAERWLLGDGDDEGEGCCPRRRHRCHCK